MKTLVLMLYLLLSPSLYSQAMNYTLQLDSPMNEVVTSTCSESVAVSGMVHGVIHLTRPPHSDTVLYESHVGPRGDMQAVGLDSGIHYNLVGNTFTRLMFGPHILESFSYVDTFKVVNLFTIHYTYHVLYGTDYVNARAFVDDLKVECNNESN